MQAVRTRFESADSAGGSLSRGRVSQLSMYNDPPSRGLSLQEFKECAIDRLNVLSRLMALKTALDDSGKVWDQLRPYLQERGLLGSAAVEKDLVSHCILRMAFCRSEENRRWLASAETALFRLRFQYSSTEHEQSDFLQRHSIACEKVNKRHADWPRIRGKPPVVFELSEAIHGGGQSGITHYYKVPFVEALELVRRRAVLLCNGCAYVPPHALLSIASRRFKLRQQEHLQRAFQAFKHAPRDKRLDPYLQRLSAMEVGFGTSMETQEGAIKASDVRRLQSAMPLCMGRSMQALLKDRHLKNGARVQFSLFLKAAGMSLDEALLFWKMHFSQADKLKEQTYAVRHQYGKVGKRVSYAAFGCRKIQGMAPNRGDACGCPFKLYSDSDLRQMLATRQCSPSAVQEILQLRKEGDLSLACLRTWKASHKEQDPPHWAFDLTPNQYFRAALEFRQQHQSKQSKQQSRQQSEQQSKQQHTDTTVATAGTSTAPMTDDFEFDDDDTIIAGSSN